MQTFLHESMMRKSCRSDIVVYLFLAKFLVSLVTFVLRYFVLRLSTRSSCSLKLTVEQLLTHNGHLHLLKPKF